MMRRIELEFIDDILKHIDFRKDVTADTYLTPAECAVIVKYITELRAANITLAQALSEVDD